jgi:glycosyltransferase involved in cell wall biosynthesis
MNVLFDCERMKHPCTGLSEYCSQLGRALKATAGEGHEALFYVPPGYETYFGAGSRSYIHSPVHRLLPLRVKQVDVWHANARAALVRSSRAMKRVVTIHDLNFLYEKTSPAKINKYLRSYQDHIDRADAVIAISDYVRADISRHLKLRGQPVFVVYNGCNVAEYPGYDTPPYRPSAPFLFSIGTVLAKKNFHVLPCLLEKNDYELIIAGNRHEAYVRTILEEAKKYRVADRVTLTGPVRDEDKYWYLSHCSAFLFPSLAEGFGIPPVEAMQFGKPVFLSTLTSLPEIGGPYAYYFDDFDPERMRQVFADGMTHYARTHPASSIIRRSRQFDWLRCAASCWKVYQSI